MISKIDTISNDDFKKIIENSKNWKEIAIGLGYSRGSYLKIQQKIIDRCDKLGIKINIDYSSPILKMTKGELFKNRKNWQSARTAIRKLASSLFFKSNKPRECAICGYDKHIEIAHIKAVSDFSDNTTIEEINDINNLIGLCPNHHWEYDNGLIKIAE